MAIYRRKPVLVEASQWFSHGDHRAVRRHANSGALRSYAAENGLEPERLGGLETSEGIQIIHPGDWIVTDSEGEHDALTPGEFVAAYEPAD
ncbi:hypothetical protein [Chromohalobacter canadensis]|uniref:hypothetical protein n=1 Tax=Chromohalobacter canadensis TaxID=141389 RepID=UPI0024106BC2|nr:hypothetical protein [Chromohalobacter canadensis]